MRDYDAGFRAGIMIAVALAEHLAERLATIPTKRADGAEFAATVLAEELRRMLGGGVEPPQGGPNLPTAPAAGAIRDDYRRKAEEERLPL